MIPRVSVHLVTWNSMTTVQDVLGALARQTFQPFGLRIIDNASTDGFVDYVRATAPQTSMIRNPHNRGIAVAHNQGVRLAMQAWKGGLHERYLLLLATDVVLDPETIERLVAFLDTHPDVGMVGPRLMKLFEENLLDEALRERVQSDHIASDGQMLSRRFYAQDQRVDAVVDDHVEPRAVFAPPTGCVLVRAEALAAIAHEGDQFLDTDFRTNVAFTDIAWRLLRAGYANVVLPEARAYQCAGVYRAAARSASSRLLGLRQRDRFLLLAKHLSAGQLLRYGPWIAFGELNGWVQALLRDKEAKCQIGLLPEVWRRARKKRHELKESAHPPQVVRPFIQ